MGTVQPSDAEIDESESEQAEPTLSLRQKFADAVTKSLRSMKYVAGQAIFMGTWIAVNTTALAPYLLPFDPTLTLLNLGLSTVASFSTSFIMMSQNRENEKNRATQQKDLKIDKETEQIIKTLEETEREQNRKLDILLAVISPEYARQVKEAEAKKPKTSKAAAKKAEKAAATAAVEKPTLRQRFADAVTKTVGSMNFVIGQAIFMTGWIVLNTTPIAPFIPQWDPNLTLLNLVLSTQAAFSASFILMSQHRQGEKDSLAQQHDLKVDQSSRKLINNLTKIVKEQNRKIDFLLAALTPEQRKAAEAALAAPPPAPPVEQPPKANDNVEQPKEAAQPAAKPAAVVPPAPKAA